MLKFEKIIIVFIVAVLFSSCSEYQKVLNKGKTADQYKMATDLFNEGKYSKAINLFEKVIPFYERKPQMERIKYMVAEANYNTKSYSLASYYFNNFIANYPNSSKIEEASFLAAHSHYLAAPKFSRDQADTQKALAAFQNFIDKYPSGEKIEEANKYYDDLTFRLEKKSFEIAKQYYKIEDYNAAIVAFENFMQDNIGTSLKEDAMYYKFKASNDLAIRSVLYKKETRLNNAIEVYNKFKKNFSDSDKMKELDKMLQNLNQELDETKKIVENIKLTNTNNNGL